PRREERAAWRKRPARLPCSPCSTTGRHPRPASAGVEQEKTEMVRALTIATLAAMIGLGALGLPAPASAGGVTVMLTPDGESAEIIQQGLRIYSMAKEQKEKKEKKMKSHAQDEQEDRNNEGVDNSA